MSNPMQNLHTLGLNPFAVTANPIFSSLSLNERNLLVEQAGYMQAYSNVLGQRIAAFAP